MGHVGLLLYRLNSKANKTDSLRGHRKRLVQWQSVIAEPRLMSPLEGLPPACRMPGPEHSDDKRKACLSVARSLPALAEALCEDL